MLLLLAVVSSPAAADLWYQHYQAALDAIERQQWAEAVSELNQAIERRGDSGVRVRTYGMRTTDYFPYLKLGIAYSELGQLRAAIQAFETEEQLGAIADSAEASADLATFRRRVQEAEAQFVEDEAKRVEQILDDSLAEARQLVAEGDLDRAMLALGRGLAVAPDDESAQGLLRQLQQESQRAKEIRDQNARKEAAVAEGRKLLEAGSFGEAATRFREALSGDDTDPEIQGLLDRAQSELLSQIDSPAGEENQAALISVALAEVSQLEQAGRLDEASARLESVLVMAPENPEALALKESLTSARSLLRKQEMQIETVEVELGLAAAHLEAGRFEEALSAANKALAADPGNAPAVAIVTRSYREVSRVLLGRGSGGNIPPAIRFADFREEQDDGSRSQIVRDPRFRLTGMVIDNSPVEIRFSDEQDRELTARIQSQQLGDFYLTEFQLETELEVGPKAIRLVATDAEKLSASSEYSVVYLRPWFRAPGFYAVAAGLAIVLFGGLVGARLRRQRLRRKRRFNPYVAGAPVLDEDLFFGRNRLIDRILQTIHNNSLLLYGERRIGKTSIQHHLRRRLLEMEDPVYEFYPVYVDLQGTPEDRFFSTIAEDVFEQLAADLVGIESSPSTLWETGYSYRDLVRDLRGVVRHLEAQTSKRVKLVLLIDEVDELNDYDPRINQRLRSLFMKSFAENLVAVVSGVEIKKHWERVGSPWYNFFEEIEIQPLEDQEARNLIEKPISGVLKIGDGAIDRILELTDRRPYLIQKLCVALVNLSYEQGSGRITLQDVEAVTRSETI